MAFIVAKKTNLNKAKKGDRFEESDLAILTDDNYLLQMEHVQEKKEKPKKKEVIRVHPGIWSFYSNPFGGMGLTDAELLDEEVLDNIVSSKEVITKIKCFFKNIKVYKKRNIFPKRGIILYGEPGVGKSTIIKEVCKSYFSTDKKIKNDTAIIIWDTSKFNPQTIKDAISTFEYVKVKKLILIIEDIGGGEAERVHSRFADSSLLKLLDNTERTFTIPTLVLATTNYPQHLLGSLANRPQRFDDKIKISPPGAQDRVKLFEFFAEHSIKAKKYSELNTLLKNEKCEDLTPAHIKDVIIRKDIYSITYEESLLSVLEDIKQFKSNFQPERQRMGFKTVD